MSSKGKKQGKMKESGKKKGSVKKITVLDANAVIRSSLDFRKGGYLIPSMVVWELTDYMVSVAVEEAVENKLIRILEPGKGYVKKAVDAARGIGELDVLSEPDIHVLALALEHQARVASDDYAVQNTALKLNLEVASTFFESISERREYVYKCYGCGREYKHRVSACDFCGSGVRKSVKSRLRP